jgi:hypothetical protein
MRIPELRLLAALTALAAGCGGEQAARPPARQPAEESRPTIRATPVSTDSLVLTLGGGAEVWFTSLRQGKDSAGTACIERAVEVRRDSVRLPVPLLYTRETPLPLNDSQFRAVLYRDCVPFAVYRVGAADGMPHVEKQ